MTTVNDEQVVSRMENFTDAITKDVKFEEIADLLIAKNLLSSDEFNHILKLPFESEKMSVYLKKFLPNKEPGYAAIFVEVLREANYSWIANEILPNRPAPYSLKSKGRKSRSSGPTEPKIKSARHLEETENGEDEVDTVPIGRMSPDEDVCGNQTPLASQPITENIDNNNILPEKENSVKFSELAHLYFSVMLYTNFYIPELTKEVVNMVSNSTYLLTRWRSFCHYLDLDNQIPTIMMFLLANPEDNKIPVIHLLKTWEQQYPKEANLGNLIKYLRESKANELAGILF